MLHVKTSVRDSSISNKGLFIEQFTAKRTVVALYPYKLSLISKEEYDRRTMENDQLVIRTGCRWLNDLFIIRESGVEDEDYINHSDDPCLLYHCGILFAKRDLVPGDELTVDYRYLLSEKDPGFFDSRSGEYVHGVPGPEALLASAMELVQLLSRRYPSLESVKPRHSMQATA